MEGSVVYSFKVCSKREDKFESSFVDQQKLLSFTECLSQTHESTAFLIGFVRAAEKFESSLKIWRLVQRPPSSAPRWAISTQKSPSAPTFNSFFYDSISSALDSD